MPKAADPVVIPPLSNIDGKFTCIGNGLLYEGHPREKPEALRVLLMPSATGDAIGDRARSKAWWTAQAIFYELPCPKTASIPTIRALLEGAIKSNSLALPNKIKELENKSNREFKKLNKEVLEKTGAGPSTGGSKASKPGDKAPKPAEKASKPSEKAAAKPAAEKPAKAAKTLVEKAPKPAPVPAPKPAKAKAPAGTSSSATGAAPKKTKPAQKAEPQATKGKSKAKRTADEAFASQDTVDERGSSPAKRFRTIQTARRTAGPIGMGTSRPKAPTNPVPDPSSSWPTETYGYDAWEASGSNQYDDEGDYKMGAGEYVDDDPDELPPRNRAVPPPGSDFVAGSWVVSCPYILSQWGHNEYMTRRFTFNIVRTNGRAHIAADFELGILHGTLRSKTLEGRPDGTYATFEWVGQEEDGPVLPPRAEQGGYIKFLKDGTCKGKINGIDVCPDDVDFEAWWTGPPGRNEHRWEDFDEEAYERARVGRW